MIPQIVLVSDTPAPDARAVRRYLKEALLEWGPNAPRIFTCGIGETARGVPRAYPHGSVLGWEPNVPRIFTCGMDGLAHSSL